MNKRIATLLVPAILMLAAGCQKEADVASAPPIAPEAVPTTSSTGSATLTQDELDSVPRSGKSYKLALVVKTRNNPFFDPMIKAAESEARALGVAMEVQAPAQESDKERQFGIVQDLTARGVDAILIAPADSKGIVPALKQAATRGVLVVNLDNRVDRDTARGAGLELAAYVGADNEAGGKLAGEAMLAAVPSGKVAVLEGIRGTDNAEARKRGFGSAVQGKLELVASDTAEWDTQKAYAKFQSMLAAHADLAGVFCANDKMALGAMKAIREAGKQGKVVVVGYDNIPDVRAHLASGELKATIEQHPDLMGRYGVKAAVGILEGKVTRGKEFLVPLEVVRGK